MASKKDNKDRRVLVNFRFPKNIINGLKAESRRTHKTQTRIIEDLLRSKLFVKP